MATSVTLPALGESVTEGTVTRWLKQPGDQVAVDEPLLEVSTDKVDTEIPSPAAGTLLEVKVNEDETVEVGAELATIGEASEAAGDGSAAAAEEAETASAAAAPADDSDLIGQPESAAPAEPAEPAQAEVPTETAQEPAAQAAAGNGAPPSAGSGTGTPVTLPALGESVTEGTVTRWLKQPGDQVAVDEPLLEVSTDKVDTEIPSPVAGTLLEVKVNEDETVEVGAELATIDAGGSTQATAAPAATQEPAAAQARPTDTAPATEAADVESQQAPRPQAQSPQAPAAPQAPAPQAPAAPLSQPPAAPQVQTAPATGAPAAQSAPTTAATSSGSDSRYVTPLVRKLAREHSVDLATISGSGVGGRIRKQDVLAAAEAAKAAAAAPATTGAPAAAQTQAQPADAGPSPLRGTRQKMSRVRKAIAAHMVMSLDTSAQLTTVVEIDVTRIAGLRAKAKASFEAREGVKLSFLPFFAKAAVEALKVYPVLNASVEDDEIVYHPTENLGIAVDAERGLTVPVIKNAGDLNLGGLARQIAELADKVRSNKLSPDDITGGTFTLTNTGSRGALFDTPIINQPQVGILGTGAVVKRPVVVTDDRGSESIAIRSMMYLSLTYDHRIVDGAEAARYLTAVKQRLEAGQFEGELGL